MLCHIHNHWTRVNEMWLCCGGNSKRFLHINMNATLLRLFFVVGKNVKTEKILPWIWKKTDIFVCCKIESFCGEERKKVYRRGLKVRTSCRAFHVLAYAAFYVQEHLFHILTFLPSTHTARRHHKRAFVVCLWTSTASALNFFTSLSLL